MQKWTYLTIILVIGLLMQLVIRASNLDITAVNDKNSKNKATVRILGWVKSEKREEERQVKSSRGQKRGNIFSVRVLSINIHCLVFFLQF